MLANLVDLSAIASVGSACSLVVFLLVGLAGYRLRSETGASAAIVLLGMGATAVVLGFFAVDTLRNAPETFVAIVAMTLLAVALDVVWKRVGTDRAAPLAATGTDPVGLGCVAEAGNADPEGASPAPTRPRSSCIRFARAGHDAGYPTADLEERVLALAGAFGLADVEVSATPTLVDVSLGSLPRQRSYSLRVRPTPVDLDAIARLDGLVEDALDGRLDADDALGALRKIQDNPLRRPWPLVLAAYAIAGVALTPVLGGGWREAGRRSARRARGRRDRALHDVEPRGRSRWSPRSRPSRPASAPLCWFGSGSTPRRTWSRSLRW